MRKKEAKSPRHQASHIEGILRITSKGIGYIQVKDREEDIEIDPEDLNTGLHKDTVRVRLHPKRRDRRQAGEITKIISRAKAGFAGVLKQKEGTYILAPSDPKMYTDIIIPEDKIKGAQLGQKVFVVITSWKDPKKTPQGKIIKVLGQPKENEAEMQAIALERGFQKEFPPPVEREAKEILRRADDESLHDSEIQKRKDFRDIITFTIDPDDAKDFDDAISIKKLSGSNTQVSIHIADVSHYVETGGDIDKEALKRGTSVYLVDRTIPMLPEILSNFLCSLRPHEDKLTFSAVFTLTPEGEVLDEWFGKTIIHSNKRFTYEEAQKTLNEKTGPYVEELHILNNIAKKLREKRFAEGAISIDQEEVKFILDEKGVPLKVYKKVREDAHRLIEEFMLLANKRVAMRIAPKGKEEEKVFLYRIHEEPDRERMSNLAVFLEKLGYKIHLKNGIIPPKEINALLLELEGKEEKDTIQTEIIRSMAKAIYSTKNIGHYGLAFEHYTHFTSPIRRYPDIVVHRLLFDYLRGIRINRDRWHEYETIANLSSVREKEAQEAEWASIKYKQVEYMSYRIGKIFDGTITGLTKWGIYAEEKETKCEGMIKLRDIGGDYYVFNERELAVVGKKTKKKYRVGDRIKIRVKHTDLDKKIIDYEIVS